MHWTEFWRQQTLYQHRVTTAWLRACTVFFRSLLDDDSSNVVDIADRSEAGNNAGRYVGNRLHGDKR